MDVEFVHHRLTVLLHGLDADAQFIGGLLVRVAFGNELEDFGLASGEGVAFAAQEFAPAFALLVLRDTLFHIGRVDLPPFGQFAHGLGQSFGGGVFGDITVDAGLEGVLDVEVVLVGRDDEDAGGGGLAADVARGVEAVEVRHGHVEGDDIGLEFGRFLGAFASVGRLTDDGDVIFAFEDHDKRFAHHAVIVNNEDCGLLHNLGSGTFPAGRFAGGGIVMRITVPCPGLASRIN